VSVRLRDLLMNQLGTLRHEPTEKRIRASLGGRTVIDTTRALLVWEPKRVVPTYAVPVDDIVGEIELANTEEQAKATGVPAIGYPKLGTRTVLDPSVPFSVHTSEGEALTIRVDRSDRYAAAFRPRDPALDGYVIVEFDGFDAWYEEEERNFAHPRDPFHRIDIVHGSRRVRVEANGVLLADSTDPYLLFEPPLPVRYYLPLGDVRTELLRPSPRGTWCAYKGQASYWSTEDEQDLAWTYHHPLREAAEIAGRIAFFNERIDLIVDNQRLERSVTPWSRRH
jgi:uncharacterized protein (DUF427 family)